MSSYRIYSPVDIKKNANTTPGEIDIYNGTTNYTKLRADAALATNTSFVLPATLGSIKDYIITNGSGISSFNTGMASCLPLNMKINGATALLPASTTSTTFTDVGYFVWRGTPIEGTPSSVNVILSGTATSSAARLINQVPGNTVATTANLSLTATPTIYNVPITGGFDAVARTIRLQIRIVLGGGTINCWFLQVIP